MKTKIFFISMALCAIMISLVSCEPTTLGKKNVLINLAELGDKINGKSIEEMENIIFRKGFTKCYEWSRAIEDEFNGTYVYANVTGFSAQRVKAQVKSMMVGGEITKVELNVYDLDCQEGFFVPSSSFRDLAKDVGAGAMNMNLNMNSTGDQSLESVAMQSLQQAFQATTSAISKNIRKNKAKIKYNTEVYLISKQ